MNERSLREHKEVGERLKSLLNHNGWKELEKYLISLYMEAFEKLKISDNAEARATLILIEKIFNWIGSKIDWGEEAKNRLVKRLNKEV